MPKLIAQSKQVVFNGDGYTDAWHQQAQSRGLPNRKTTIDSLPDLVSAKSIALFGKHKVFSERELHSRLEIFLEGYKKTIAIEALLTAQIARRQILPAALRYQSEVAGSIANLRAADLTPPKSQTALLSQLVDTIEALQSGVDRLEAATDHHANGDTLAHATHARDAIIPAMQAVRDAGDTLETLVAADLWPLPTYQEMLFIK